MNIQQLIKMINLKNIVLMSILGVFLYTASSFELISLQIQSEKLNKTICIQEMIPSGNPIPLEVIK
jgi:hypothetical protein